MQPNAWSFLIVLAVMACDRTPAPRAPAPPAPAAAAPTPAAHGAAVDRLIGVWAGEADTPLGAMPIALEFSRQPDGSVHGRLDDGKGMYLDFRFHRAGDAWLLTEEGAIGKVRQKHVLVPGHPGARWVERDDPALLEVTIEVDARTLVFSTRLRGEDHAAFRMQRLVGEAAEQVRRELAALGVSSS